MVSGVQHCIHPDSTHTFHSRIFRLVTEIASTFLIASVLSSCAFDETTTTQACRTGRAETVKWSGVNVEKVKRQE